MNRINFGVQNRQSKETRLELLNKCRLARSERRQKRQEENKERRKKYYQSVIIKNPFELTFNHYEHNYDDYDREVASKIPVEQIEEKIDLSKIIKTNIANGQKKYSETGFKGHHGHIRYSLAYSSVTISDSVGGCGVQQLYQWTSTNDNTAKKLLEEILEDLHFGVGIILCQVGMDYFKHPFTKALEELGFKYHEEYDNYQHDKGYKGRIYSFLINEPKNRYEGDDF